MDNAAPPAASDVSARWTVPPAGAIAFAFEKPAPYVPAFQQPAPLPLRVPDAPDPAPVLTNVINSSSRSLPKGDASENSTKSSVQDATEGGVAHFLIGSSSTVGGIKRKGGPAFFRDSIEPAPYQAQAQITLPPSPKLTTEMPFGERASTSTSGAAKQPATKFAAPRPQINQNTPSRNVSPTLKLRADSSLLAATVATKPRVSMHPRQEKQRRADFQSQPIRNEGGQELEIDHSAEAPVKRRKVDVDEIIAGVSGIQSRLDAKTHEIKALNALLAESKSQVTKLTTEKESLKSKFGAKLRASLAAFEITKKELDATISSMRDMLVENRRSYGDGVTSEAMQQELATLKDLLGSRFFSDEGALWLERHEESKLVVLRDLQHELAKHTAVIAHLRDQLATKTGETAEARDRISSLERARDVAQDVRAAELKEWAESKGVLLGELAALRKAEDERVLGVASMQELEERLQKREGKCEELENEKDQTARQLAAAEHQFEMFRQRTVADQDLAAQDLTRKTDELARLANDLSTALAELVPLRPLPSRLATTQLELDLAQTKLADVTTRAKAESAHHSTMMDGLQTAFTNLSLERDGKAARFAELQSDLDALVVEKRELLETESNLRISLSASHTALGHLETKAKTSHDFLSKKNADITNALELARTSAIASERETAALQARFAALELKCTTLQTENAELVAAHQSALSLSEAEITRLRAEVDDRDSVVNAAAAKTEKACNAAAAIELASVKNDLKKVRWQYDDKAQALVRALGELAKARGRPGIEQSSSLDGDEDSPVAAPHPTPDPIDAGARENSPPPAPPAPQQPSPAVDPRQVVLTHNPDAAPKPKKKTPINPIEKSPAPASELEGKQKATRRGRSTARSAKDRDASDEIEDDDSISVQHRPATKTYAKRRKA